MKTKIIIPTLIISLIFSSFLLIKPVYAQESQPGPFGFFKNFFSQVAQKFGFKKNPVTDQQNFQDGQKDRPQGSPNGSPRSFPSGSPMSLENMLEERLDKLVSDGKITEEQKTAILAKIEALQAEYSLDSLTGEERQEKMQEMMEKLKTWAQEQGIDQTYIMFQFQERQGQPEGQQGKRQDKPGQRQ